MNSTIISKGACITFLFFTIFLLTVGDLQAQNCSVNAGLDQEHCASTTVTLQGNISGAYVDGTLQWAFVSGPSTPVITNSSSLSTVVTGMDNAGVYTFSLSSDCGVGSASDQVLITMLTPATGVSPSGGVPPTCYTAGTPVAFTGIAPAGHTLTWRASTDAGVAGTFNGGTATVFTGNSPTVQFTLPPNAYCDDSRVRATISVTSTNTTTGCEETRSTTRLFWYDFGAINAYAETPVCGTCAGLFGTCEQDGAGSWSIISEPVGSSAYFTNPNKGLSSLCNLQTGGTYTVRWTVSGAPCVNGSEDVTFTATSGSYPSQAVTESLQFCDEIPSQVVISGNDPQAGETVSWTQISGSPVTIENPNNPSTQLSGITAEGAPYQFVYSIQNPGGCSTWDTMKIAVPPIHTLNGSNADNCQAGTSTTDWIGFTPNYTAHSVDSLTITVNYISGPMAAFNARMYIRQYDGPWVTSTKYICGDQLTEGSFFTTVAYEDDLWPTPDIIKTGIQLNITTNSICGNPAISSCGVLEPGIYNFQMTVDNGCSSISAPLSWELKTSVNSTAGTDQMLSCNDDTTSLAGVTSWNVDNFNCTQPMFWQTVNMPSGAIDPIHSGNEHELNPHLENLIPGTYKFAFYPVGTVCSITGDSVQVIVSSSPPGNPTVTGPSSAVCYGIPFELSGEVADGVAGGTWSIVSTAPAGGTGTFSPDINSPEATFTPNTPNTAYTIRWQVGNGCGTAITDIIVNTTGSTTTLPLIANATDCSANYNDSFGTLTANIPGGTWTSNNANYTLSTPASQTTTVSPNFEVLNSGEVVFYYTVTNACGTFQDSVGFAEEMNFGLTPPGGNFCDVASFPFTQNFETPNSTAWTDNGTYIIELIGPGNPSSPSFPAITTPGYPSLSYDITFNEAGTYTYRLIKITGGCHVPTDWTTVQISEPAPLAVAGADIALCGATTSASLSAQPDPLNGGTTGRWTVDEIYTGEAPTISNTTIPDATVTFSGDGVGDVLLRWSVYGNNPDCGSSTYDLVRVTYTPDANAGEDDAICYVFPSTGGVYALQASSVPEGAGTWSIISEPVGSTAGFVNASSYETSIIDLMPGSYTLRWTVAATGCTTTTDDLVLTVSGPPAGTCTLTGPNSTTNTSEQICGGAEISSGTGPAWTNLGNTAADDNAYTNVSVSPNNGPSQFLDITPAGLNIPLTSVIQGIEVSIIRKEGNTDGQKSIEDNLIQLLENGTPVGNDKAVAGAWPIAETAASYGGAADLWGYSWDDTNINDLGFRIQVQTTGNGNGSNTERADIEQVCIAIYYAEPPTYYDTDLGIAISSSGVTGATSYAWTLPVGASIASGDGTNAITVDFNNSGLTGLQTICATPSNDCSDGAECCYYFLMNDLDAGSVGNRVWLDENSDGTQDAGEPGIPNVTVELQDGICTSGSNCPIAITDANGGYLFKSVVPGNYTVNVLSELPAGLNLIYDEDDGTTSPDGNTSVTVTAGEEYLTADFGYNYTTKDDTDNPAMTDTGAFGDRIWNDANGNGIQDSGEGGIDNITVNLYDDDDGDGIYDNLVQTTTTDPYGNYIFDGLTPNAYVVEVDEADIIAAGFNTTPTSDPDGDPDGYRDNISRPVVIAPGDVWLDGDFGYQASGTHYDIGSQLFVDVDGSGTFNTGDAPLGGVSMALVDDANDNGIWDSGEAMVATTRTAANGTYLFPDLTDNSHFLVVVTDTENVINDLTNTVDPDGGTANQSAVHLNGANALTEDFGYVPTSHDAADGFVGDLIFLDSNGDGSFDAGESGIEGVVVELLDGDNDDLLANNVTDENGHYYFGNLPAGNYKVRVQTSSLPTGLTNSIDPDGSSPGDNITNSFALAASQRLLDKDFGYQATTPRTISGTIWEDESAEGTLDAGETTRFENVSILLLDGNGNIVSTTTTDGSGNYSFTGIPSGSYTVEVTDNGDLLTNYWHSLGTDSEPDPVIVDVSSGNATDVDFGYYIEGAALGNRVWIDYNGNDVQDTGEPGLPGALITLEIDFDMDGTTDVTVRTLSGSDGGYSFGKLLLDEDHLAFGSGPPPPFRMLVTLPDAEMAARYTAATADQGGNDKTDSDDHTGHTITSIAKGQKEVALQSDPNSESAEAAADFGYSLNCTDPKVEYAICNDGSDQANADQTTDYFWMIDATGQDSMLYHQKMVGQKNGRIRSWTYCESGGWHYYYNPQDPDEFLFAIEHGTNTTPIEYIEIRIDDNATDRHKSNDADATFVMIRDWHVKTVNDDPLTANVNIRFYFPPNEYKQMLDAAKAKATEWGTANQPNETMVQWFKKPTFDPDNDIDEANTILTPFDMTAKRAASTDADGNNTALASPAVENSKNHIQFNGITGFSGGTAMIHINRASLPVELSRFEGQVQGCNTMLTWYAQTEENFSHYELEWSGDGRHYQEIATVDGLGSTNTGQAYQYFDELASVHNYYRLKMVDIDGTYEYSKVVHLQTGCDDEYDITVYPNPIGIHRSVLNVKFFSEREETDIIVVDMLGQVLQRVNLGVEMGWNTLRIRVSDLPAGTYFIKQPGSRGAARFVVQE